MTTAYDLEAHGAMMRDRVRMDAYAAALRAAITPGAVVVDVGAGAGVLSLLACRYGAARVYAIEPSETIEVARRLAAANGVGDRIRFLQALSTRVTLPEPADVVVSDLRGVLPLFERHLLSVVDARRRFLRAGRTLIPRRDVLWAAVAAVPDLYEPYRVPWANNADGLDLRVVRPLATNTWTKCRARPAQLLLPGRRWATLDYTTLDEPGVGGALDWDVAEAGTAHGLVLWFDAELGEGAAFSNAPGAPEALYGQAFFPWPEPVVLAPGDHVAVSLGASLTGNDYIWCWSTTIRGRDGGSAKADFHQSTFFGAPLSRATLARRAADHVPSLGEEGRVALFILKSLEAGTALGEIAEALMQEFPCRWAGRQEALSHVADLCVAYGR